MCGTFQKWDYFTLSIWRIFEGQYGEVDQLLVANFSIVLLLEVYDLIYHVPSRSIQ